MDSRFVCLVMLGLVTVLVAARLWVEGRMNGQRSEIQNGESSTSRGAIAEGLEEKGDLCEWWS